MSTKKLIAWYWHAKQHGHTTTQKAVVYELEQRETDRMTMCGHWHKGTLANGWFLTD